MQQGFTQSWSIFYLRAPEHLQANASVHLSIARLRNRCRAAATYIHELRLRDQVACIRPR